MKHDHLIRNQVLHGIALNREPGYHFVGNFLDISFDRVTSEDTRLSLEPGPHCLEHDGQINIGVVAMLADLALAASVRAGPERVTRLATVDMNLHFTGVPLKGRLEAASAFQGFVRNGSARQGLSRVEINSGTEQVCFGSGAFMVLRAPKDVRLPPVPQRRRGTSPMPLISESELKGDEVKILRHAEAALAMVSSEGGAFIRRFCGYQPHHIEGGASCAMTNGPHIGNRVGHVQGGILLGLAAATASAALPRSWVLTETSAWYMSPGEGQTLRAKSRILHQGRLIAVIRTQVTGRNKRRVLEVVTTHACHA